VEHALGRDKKPRLPAGRQGALVFYPKRFDGAPAVECAVHGESAVGKPHRVLARAAQGKHADRAGGHHNDDGKEQVAEKERKHRACNGQEPQPPVPVGAVVVMLVRVNAP